MLHELASGSDLQPTRLGVISPQGQINIAWTPPPLPHGTDPLLCDLIAACLRVDQATRPTAADLLALPGMRALRAHGEPLRLSHVTLGSLTSQSAPPEDAARGSAPADGRRDEEGDVSTFAQSYVASAVIPAAAVPDTSALGAASVYSTRLAAAEHTAANASSAASAAVVDTRPHLLPAQPLAVPEHGGEIPRGWPAALRWWVAAAVTAVAGSIIAFLAPRLPLPHAQTPAATTTTAPEAVTAPMSSPLPLSAVPPSHAPDTTAVPVPTAGASPLLAMEDAVRNYYSLPPESALEYSFQPVDPAVYHAALAEAKKRIGMVPYEEIAAAVQRGDKDEVQRMIEKNRILSQSQEIRKVEEMLVRRRDNT